jgi:hypothetical protein
VQIWCRPGADLVQICWRSGADLVQIWAARTLLSSAWSNLAPGGSVRGGRGCRAVALPSGRCREAALNQLLLPRMSPVMMREASSL